MSLILDALRRADAQRERDPRRGIHAQPAQPADDDDAARFIDRLPMARRLLPWAAALVLGLAALVGWREARQDPRAWAQSHSLPPLPASTGPRIARPPEPAPAILPPPAGPPAAGPSSGPPTPAARSPQAAPGPVKLPRAGAAPVPATPPASASRTSHSLPADAPALRISGSVYADSPGQRLLIVNGQVHGEGAEPVPGVRVEQIQPAAAVLRYRGQRYEVGF